MTIKIIPNTRIMNLYQNISNRELPTLLRVSYELNKGDMEETAADLETIDKALGLLRNRSLINARSRKAKVNRWSTNRNFKDIMENILLQRKEKS